MIKLTPNFQTLIFNKLDDKIDKLQWVYFLNFISFDRACETTLPGIPFKYKLPVSPTSWDFNPCQ